MAPVPVELEIKPPANEDEVVLIADFDQFAEAQTGPVLKAEPVSGGYNSEIAIIVYTEQARAAGRRVNGVLV
ncbi:MAG: hypothetical protein ACRDTF_13380 [Pseudonocardiaceae bacterium]